MQNSSQMSPASQLHSQPVFSALKRGFSSHSPLWCLQLSSTPIIRIPCLYVIPSRHKNLGQHSLKWSFLSKLQQSQSHLGPHLSRPCSKGCGCGSRLSAPPSAPRHKHPSLCLGHQPRSTAHVLPRKLHHKAVFPRLLSFPAACSYKVWRSTSRKTKLHLTKARKLKNIQAKQNMINKSKSWKYLLAMRIATQADLGNLLSSILQANRYRAQFQEIYAVKEYYKQLTAVIPIIFHSF